MTDLGNAFGFRTERLVVHTLPPGAPEARLVAEASLVLTPKTTVFLPPELQIDANDSNVTRWLSAAQDEAQVLLVREKPGALLGFMILNQMAGDAMMLGYLLAETAWGQGYATELLRGLLDELRRLGQKCRIIGGVAQENTGSIAVLRKAGFLQLPDRRPGGPVFYAIDLTGETL